MKIIIDILHPAHVHIFRIFYKEMAEKGHDILVTAREKDVALYLLDYYGIPYIKISKIAKNKLGLIPELFLRSWRFYKIAKKFKPDVLMGCMGPTIAPVGKIINVPSIVFYNNETAFLTNWYVYRLATAFVTSTSYEEGVRGNHITHNSYHELAYLYPGRFQPDAKVLQEAGLKKEERFFFVRFVSWQSSHDIGAQGFTNKLEFLKKLEKYGRVVINTENKKLPEELKRYTVNVAPEKIHSLMYYATMVLGESATMAAEAAVMGVPAVYLASTMRGYTNELEKKYGLVYNFKNQKKAEAKVFELIKRERLKGEWKKKLASLFKERIDLASWMMAFIENRQWKKTK